MYKNLQNLKEILDKIVGKKIFIVCGKSSYQLSGAEKTLERVLNNYTLKFFSDFTSNPKIIDVKKGVESFLKFNPDIIMAVGGGSVIDIAKTINIVSVNQGSSPENLVRGINQISIKGLPFIAIPTTAGSGSEATHFSVVYINKVKYSLAHDFLLPDFCVLDSELTMSTPKTITANSGIDALCQSIESIWSVKSTDDSLKYAKKAIVLILTNIEDSVNLGTKKSRSNMLYASHLAGKAINITKTTACHATSYPMTSYFGVSHGNAVGITLPEFLKWNYYLTEDDLNDERGVFFVKNSIMQINKLFGCKTVEETAKKIVQLLKKIGLHTSLEDLGIISKSDIDLVLSNINIERMNNNPRKVKTISLRRILSNIK